MKRSIFLALFLVLLPLRFSDAALMEKLPIGNGNFLGRFDINGIEVWQVILGTLVTPASASELSLKDQVKNHIRAMSDVMGLDRDFMLKLGSCESWDYKEDVINNIQLGDDGASMGVFQWQKKSWEYYSKKFNLVLDRTKWVDQVRLTALVADKYGTAKDWVNCTRFAKTGIYFK